MAIAKPTTARAAPVPLAAGPMLGIRNLGTTGAAAITQAIQWTRQADGGGPGMLGNLLGPGALQQINAAIKWDPPMGAGAAGLNTSDGFFPTGQLTPTFGFLDRGGTLTVPGRGRLRVRTGDIVAVDQITGWPILLSAYSISATGSLWTLSGVIS